MDDILIERLVLDIPSLTPAQAEELSEQVGKGLVAAKPKEGSFGSLIVDLNDEAVARDLPRLAEAIVDSIMQQIG
jgi:hypothetical protein